MSDTDPYRLPSHVTPSHYELRIEPDIDDASFTGEVTISVMVAEACREIVCNSAELGISAATLTDGDGRSARPLRAEIDAELERLTLGDGSEIPAGGHRLTISFTGTLNDRLTGFYRSTFTDRAGGAGQEIERALAVTQFEATHARQAFPCWDEPGYKASFGVTLVVDADHLAVSNAAVIAEEPLAGGRKAVRFADTMVMSTYLVAFVVGPLEATAAVDAVGVPVRVVHLPGQTHLTHYALDVATSALAYLSDYYGIDYPGDKLDLVAVPDFAFGAMENLGCITFREALLLVDPETASKGELQRVTDVINHELAHMWFGDLVTMKWWNGIWLNEAFATFMEVAATDSFRPEWKAWDGFARARAEAFDIDSLRSTRPIEYPVHSPDDAEGMFDVLTYEKGAAVVRMLEQYLGEERFRDGIRLYLDRYRYANTETTDLWDSIEEATGEPARRIMDSWILQGGHPVVVARAVPSDPTGTVELSQRPSRAVSDADDGSAEDRLWAVPVTMRATTEAGRSVRTRVLLDEADGLARFDTTLRAGSLVVNESAAGFYRVGHDPADVARTARAAATSMDASERFAFLDDTWMQVLRGEIDAVAYLGILESFRAEDETVVLHRVVKGLGSIDRLIDEPVRPAFARVAADLLRPAFERVGAEPRIDDDDLALERRGLLLGALGTIGADPDALALASSVHRRYESDPASVDPALVTGSLTVVATHADEDTYETLTRHFRVSKGPQEMLRYLYALAAPDDPELVAATRELTLTDEVRTQDAPYVLGRALSHRIAGPATWEFIRDHWSTICKRFPSGSLVRMLEGMQSLTDPSIAEDIRTFFSDHPLPQAARILEQNLERMAIGVSLAERERKGLTAALTR